MNAAKAAVTHDEQYIVRVHMGHDMGYDVIYISAYITVGAGCFDVCKKPGFIEALFRCKPLVVLNGGDNGKVGIGQGFCQLLLEQIADGGVASRFKEHPETALRETLA